MKKTLLSSVALLGLTAGAFAADLPSRRMAPAPYVAVPVFTWTGFYIGANAGGIFGSNNDRNDDPFGFGGFGGGGLTGSTVPVFGGGFAPVTVVTPATTGFGFNNRNRDNSGFAGGGQIGYNYQVGQIVWGVEVDIQGTSIGNNRNNDFGFGTFGFGGLGAGGLATAIPVDGAVTGVGILPGTGAAGIGTSNVAFFNNINNNNNIRRNIDWFGTARGRVGYAWDRTLLYVTGGVAFTDSGNNNNNNLFGFGAAGTGAALPAAFFVSPAAALAGAAVTPGNAFLFNRRNDNNDIGYAVGGGIEYAFTNNWTAKIEGLYVNFDNGNNNRNNNGFNQVVGVSNNGAPILRNQVFGFNNRNNNNEEFGVVRAGLNYKFW